MGRLAPSLGFLGEHEPVVHPVHAVEVGCLDQLAGLVSKEVDEVGAVIAWVRLLELAHRCVQVLHRHLDDRYLRGCLHSID